MTETGEEKAGSVEPQGPRPTDRESVVRSLREIFSEHLSLDGIDEDTGLFSQLNLDSLQQLTLVVEIENRFKICFDEADEESLETVSDLVDRILHHLEASASP